MADRPCQMRLLIDTDPGIDDALALLLALSSPGVRVEAITTVAGNVSVEQATDNVFHILDAARPAARPRVARGADRPLERPLLTAAHVHGDDGLGHLDRLVEPDGRPRYPVPPHDLETIDAADLILETADRRGEELVLVALGPLTNVALALARDRAPLARASRIVVMGGAVWEPGNVTPAAEFNFHVDPEAAAAVLAAGLPIELVTLDVTRRTVLDRRRLGERLARSASPVASFVADFTRHGFAFSETREGGGITLHDPLAVGVALDPSLVALEPFHLEVECAGVSTRGMTVADRRSLPAHLKRPPTCKVAVAVDAPRFLDVFLERLCPASA